jgi:molybdate transport system permease protein
VLSITGVRVFFNFNPLLKLDGYYLLSDLIEIPNLRQRALGYVSGHLRWLLWGSPRPVRDSRGKVLLGFGVASWLFSMTFVSIILVAIGSFLWGRLGLVGAGLGVVVGLMVLPRLFQGLFAGEVQKMFVIRRKRTAMWVVALAAVPAVVLGVPLIALLWRLPWSSLGSALTTDAAKSALGLSLWTSLIATALCVVFGLPLAWTLSTGTGLATRLIRALCLLPIVLPPVVGGVALLLAFGRRGVVGQWLADIGIQLSFSTAGVILAQSFVALPFFVLSVEAALRQLDVEFAEVAHVHGASPIRVFLSITLPSISPAIAAGAVLAWARALGEFGATITFAGQLEGQTQTLPLAVYDLLDRDPAEAIVLSAVLVVIAVVVLVALRDRWFGVFRSESQR